MWSIVLRHSTLVPVDPIWWYYSTQPNEYAEEVATICLVWHESLLHIKWKWILKIIIGCVLRKKSLHHWRSLLLKASSQLSRGLMCHERLMLGWYSMQQRKQIKKPHRRVAEYQKNVIIIHYYRIASLRIYRVHPSHSSPPTKIMLFVCLCVCVCVLCVGTANSYLAHGRTQYIMLYHSYILLSLLLLLCAAWCTIGSGLVTSIST